MKVVPYVLAILFLMGLLTLSSVRQTLVHQSGERAYVGAISALREGRSQYDTVRFMQPSPIKGPRKSSSRPPRQEAPEGDDEESQNRWRFTRYDTLLDLNQLPQHQTKIHQGGLIDHYKVLTRLLHLLYSNQPWWSEGLEHEIADALVAKLDGKLPSPDQVANIDLGDQRLQDIYYRMIKGGDQIPSLLDYLSAEPASKPQPINLYHAPEALIAALFDSAEQAHEIVLFRTELIKKMEERTDAVSTGERNRTLNTAMSQKLADMGINRALYNKQLIEIQVKPRNAKYRYITLIGRDPATQIETKQRIRIELG
jgi:hypothetical protein